MAVNWCFGNRNAQKKLKMSEKSVEQPILKKAALKQNTITNIKYRN